MLLTITETPRSAIPKQIGAGEIGPDLFRCGPEIIDGMWLVGQDGPVGDEDAVYTQALPCVREPEGMVQHQGRVWVGKAVQVPIRLSSISFRQSHL